MVPNDIKLHRRSRQLELCYSDAGDIRLSCELLRVYSPSAEVKGHGPGQEVLQTGKKDVNISKLVPVGNYALQIVFDDGHDSGLYSWDYLWQLGQQQDMLWQQYLQRLHEAGASRDPDVQIIKL